MPVPKNYHGLSPVDPASKGSFNLGGEEDIYKAAELIRPRNTALEQKVSTMSRVAVRVLDRETGKAIGLEEITPEFIGAETPAGAQSKADAAADNARDVATRSSQHNTIAFYDDFDDLRRYPNGTQIFDTVTSPKVGLPWYFKPFAQDQDQTLRPTVFNGAVRSQRNNGGYLAAHAIPKDSQKWAMGFEFTREASRFPASVNHGCTITVGSAPLINGNAHGAWGNWHVNFNNSSITAPTIFGAKWTAVVDAAADTITVSNPQHTSGTIETGDYVLVFNEAGSQPGGVAANLYWYAIKTAPGVIKLATTRANALAGTAIDITTAGANVFVKREMEPVNRPADNWTWLAPNTHGRIVAGSSANDTLAFDFANFSTVYPVSFEGDSLPAPLVVNTPYYLRDVTRTATGMTAKVSLTPGGAAIDLTTNGGTTFMRGVEPNLEGGLVNELMAYGTRNIICMRREFDYMHMELVGVGTISFYYRDLDAVMGASGEIGFYWQAPPESSGAAQYRDIYALHAAWVDAPLIEDERLRKYNGYLNTLSGAVGRIPGRLDLIPGNGSLQGYGMRTSGTLATMRQIMAGTGTADAGNSKRKITNGNYYAEGVFASHLGFPDSSITALGIAPASLSANRDTAVSNTQTVDERLTFFEACMVLEPGDMEEIEICGFTTGTNAKSIRLVNQYDDSFPVFNSNAAGTPLNALAAPFKIKVLRRQVSGTSHLTYASMEVAGTVIGPQRQSRNFPTDYKYYEIRATCADVGAITIETIRRTVHRVKLR